MPGFLFSPRVRTSFHTQGSGPYHVRIAQLTDLHLDRSVPLEKLREIVARTNECAPDAVVFTGDVCRTRMPYPWPGEAARILRSLCAPLGCFAVRGNHDLRGLARPATNILRQAGFVYLYNRFVRVPLAGGGVLAVGGVDDGYYGQDRANRLLPMVHQRDAFRLVLLHEPMLARTVPQGAADLILAGHTHAGQVNIPLVRRLWLPRMSGPYASGQYDVNGMPLYVSAGLGESVIGMRLFCREEVAVFDCFFGREEESCTQKKDF